MNSIEVFYGSLTDKKPRNLFVPDNTTEIERWIYRAQMFKSELYSSLFSYDNEIKDHKAYNGNIYLRNEIILDIDKTEHIVEVENELRHYSSFDLYNSGTGYHIHMPSTILDIKQDRDTPLRVRDIFYSIFKDKIDLIYDKQRLIRVNGTINKKNGKSKKLIKHIEGGNKTLTSSKSFPINTIIVNESVEYKDIENIQRLCIRDILNEPAVKGTRHQNILRVVGALREQGYSKPLITDTLMKKYQDETMSMREIETMIDTAEKYTYGCNDIVMKTRCHDNCMYYVKPVNVEMIEPEIEKKDIYTIEEIEPCYVDYITNQNRNTLNLRHYLDLDHDYIIRGGELVVVIGDTKVGKTAFVQNLTMYAKYNAEKILYISLEVGKELLFRRFIQIENDMTKAEVDHAYKDNKLTDLSLIQEIKHVGVMTETKTLRELDNIVKHFSLIIVDTIDGIKEYGESIQRIERIALGLKELAVKHNTIIIGIHHISKHILDTLTGKTKPLTLHSGKGSSSVEQKADKVIGIENHNTNDEEHKDSKMTQIKKITSLAARDEQNFTKLVEINFETFKINTKINDPTKK